MYEKPLSYAPKVEPTSFCFLHLFKRNLLLLSPFILILLTTSSCKESTYASISEEEEKSREEYVQDGKYLVEIMGCHDCHSPKKMGERGPEIIPDKLLSGYQADGVLPEISEEALSRGWMLMVPDLTAAAGPWGITFAANLTSDETGTGNWTLDQFRRALTEGKYKGLENGRPLLPPMPWPNWKDLEEEDVKAIYYYLQSTPPVENVVPNPIPPTWGTVAEASPE